MENAKEEALKEIAMRGAGEFYELGKMHGRRQGIADGVCLVIGVEALIVFVLIALAHMPPP